MRLSAKKAFALWASTAAILLHVNPAVGAGSNLDFSNGGLAITDDYSNNPADNDGQGVYSNNVWGAAQGSSSQPPGSPPPSSPLPGSPAPSSQPPSDSLAFAYAPSGNGLAVSNSSSMAPSAPVGAGWWGESTSLHLARQDFQALLIQKGPLTDRILAVGGCCKGIGSLSSTEIFNPADGSWTSAGDLQSPRWLFQAVAMANGSALATGGLSIAKGGVLNSTEIFVPSTGSGGGTWRQVAAMNTPRQDFQALLMDSGEVLAAGGFTPSSEIYNPTQDQWTQTSRMAMAEARSSFQMVKLGGGKVLAAGGRGRNSAVVSTSELFDPSTLTWTPQDSMMQPRAYFAAVVMKDGRVLAAGGRNDMGMNLNRVEIYDPSTGQWKAAGSMKYQRSAMEGVALPSGRVLVVGGLGGVASAGMTGVLSTAEIYDPATDQWMLTDPMQAGRYVFQLVELSNGTCMAIGGTSSAGFTTSTELFQTA